MYLFYIDDSGDTGLNPRSPTDAFVLSTVIVRDTQWLYTLDELVSFRRFLSNAFGIKRRDEIKANYLVHGKGSLNQLGLSFSARMNIYKMALRFQLKVGTIATWAIVIDKHKWDMARNGGSTEVREMAWKTMIERIERFTAHNNETGIIFPDEGNPDYVRQMFRRMRRHNIVAAHYGGVPQGLPRPARLIVEDPNFRKSSDSYFVQLADLNAYAAYRTVYPLPTFDGGMWAHLGDCRVAAVNKLSGGNSWDRCSSIKGNPLSGAMEDLLPTRGSGSVPTERIPQGSEKVNRLFYDSFYDSISVLYIKRLPPTTLIAAIARSWSLTLRLFQRYANSSAYLSRCLLLM